MKETDSDKLKKFNAWAWESQWAAREWRSDSWRSCELYDGGDSAWTQADWDEAVDAGIDPITVSRAFPAINKMLGGQVVNRFEIIAKGRTKEDTENAQVMTEGIKFVMDQYGGEFLISHAHADALVPGVGFLAPCFNDDPRKERVAVRYRDWREVWWDPFSSPWWTPERTRYVFRQAWMDIEDLQAIFPDKKKDIDSAYAEISGQFRESGYSSLMDEAQEREEKIRTLSSTDWIDAERKRVRPIEMYYPVLKECLFAIYPDGRCYEINDELEPVAAFQIIKGSQQVMRAIVKKMRACTFFGEHLLLQDQWSPYPHDQFPIVPFVGYIDRWGFPYGVPRQIEGQLSEVNKRRSMALAMLKKRRVTIEEDAVSPTGNQEMLDNLYDEANKLDGFMIVKSGGINKIKIEDLANLSQYQLSLLQQSEYEIRDITGSDSPLFGGEQGQSGVSKQMDSHKSALTTATLTDNLRRSMSLLGYQLQANIKTAWKYEKILRVTDKMTGAERFVKVNDPLTGKHNITQGKFDLVISEAPITDTIREKNLELLYSAIQKSPPQAVPVLLVAAFEMSDLPNKEILIEKLKPILGVAPGEEDVDPEQAKQMAMEAIKGQQAQSAKESQLNDALMEAKLKEAQLKNLELAAKIKKLQAETQKVSVDTEIAADDHEIGMERAVFDGFEKGIEIDQKMGGLNAQGSGSGLREESGTDVAGPPNAATGPQFSGLRDAPPEQPGLPGEI